jgi:hypothetical protein
MKLRSRLYLLVAGALAPMVIFAVVAAVLLLRHESAAVERDAIGRARAAMSAVDVHLRASIASLETLATSKHLESGDIAAFHEESQRVLRTQPSWVNIGLASADKMQLSNAVYAFGKPEPLTLEDHSFLAVLRGAKAGIGSVAVGTAVRSPTVRVRVPVHVGDEVRYVISAPLNLRHLATVLEAQRVPQDWMIALIDRDQNFIVRIPPVAAGAPVPEGLRQAVGAAPEGWLERRASDGRRTYTPYVTSQLSGWVLAIVMPGDAVDADARRTFVLLGAGALLALAIGGLLAWLIAKRISPDPAG